jgi:ligand-binding SRPBCC domain-containing protein
MTFTFVRSCELPVPVDEAFAWHARDGALERLLPPWEGAKLIRRSGGIRDGAETEIMVRIGPIPVRWRAVHFGFEENRQFCDRQVSGPFVFWEHHHAFRPGGASSCTLEDRIHYQPPLGALGAYFGRSTVEQKLQRMFNYRHAVTRADLADHARYRDRPRLRVGITGATGLVGTALSAFLNTGGHSVVHLKRSTNAQPSSTSSPSKAPTDQSISQGRWNPQSGEITLPQHSQPLDAVVHLAGEGIAKVLTTI